MNSRESHRRQTCVRSRIKAQALTTCRDRLRATRVTGIVLIMAITVGCAGQGAQQEAMEARQTVMEAEIQALGERAREAEIARQQAEQSARQLREELER